MRLPNIRRFFQRGSTFCPKLWDEVYIHDNGNVYTCCHEKPQALGNIYRDRMADLWNGELLQRLRQDSLRGRLGCYHDCTLLKKEEITPEPKPLSVPYSELRRIKILFGEGCNISCIMCPQNHRSRVHLDEQKLIENLDLAPFERIELQGGEPLFIMAARRFFDHATSQGKKVSFLTNGIIINDEWAEKIARHSSFVYFSLNAATKETHELVNRGSKWERVLRNIQRVRAARDAHGTDLRIVGHMTIVPENVAEIPSFIRRYREFGFDAINFGFDEGVPAYLKSALDPARRRQLAQEIQAALAQSGDGATVNSLRLQLLGLV
jgi:MoaA/NifB/PqqE/SkfB family radical SAM enzyme